ncbi:MAG: TonB family protein [Opitutaceae bacterium]
MRRDLIIGLIVSLAIHGGVAWWGELTKHGPPKVVAQKEEQVVQLEMPPLEPDEPEKVQSDEPPTPLDIAPPMQQDVPQLVQVDSFVQPIQPPPPEGLKPMTGMMVIPQGNRGLGKGIEVFDISKLDKIPVAKFQSQPQYPFEMRRAGVTGEVLVDFIVTAEGDVRNAYAAHSTQREFEAAAVTAVSKWKFRPGQKNGHPVATHMQIPIGFTLTDN